MRSDFLRAKDIIAATREIRSFTHGKHAAELHEDRVTWLAVVKLLENIGETIKHLSPEFRYAHSTVDWSLFMESRNKTAHTYWDINPKLLREKIKAVRSVGRVLEKSRFMKGWDSKRHPKTSAELDQEIALFMQKPRHAKYRAKSKKLVKKKIIRRKGWF